MIRLFPKCTIITIIAAAICSFAANGQTNKDASSQQLDSIIVTDFRSPNNQSASIGKLGAAIKDVPQSISIVERAILERQLVLRLDEALQNVPGVYVMGATGGYQQELAGRGYAYNSSNTFKNGVRYNNTAMPEVSALERVEVLRGAAAILYGNVAAGGVLNLVTKKPLFESGGEIGMRAGSYDFYKPSVDVYGAVAGSRRVAYRLNATYEKGRSYRDAVSMERIYAAPALLFKIGPKTEALIEGDYLKDARTLDYGTGAVAYTVADIPRNRFLGAAWSYAKLMQQSATLSLTHRLSRVWSLRSVTGVQDFSSDVFGTTRPNSGTMVQTSGKWMRGIQRTGIMERYYSTTLDATAHLSTGKVSHTIVIGGDADVYRTATSIYNAPAKYDSVNIYNPTLYAQRTDIPAVSVRTITTAPIRRAGVYAQDLIALSKTLKMLAGLRYSYQSTGSEILTVANDSLAKTTINIGAFSPVLGVVYQPASARSFFASYTNSFTLNTGVDVNGAALPPSIIDQYECGAKTELFAHVLTANLSLYRIVNSNLAQISLANGNSNTSIKELAGTATSDGAELDVQTRSWRGFSLIAGYSYNDTRYTRSNTFEEGSRLRYNPSHTGNTSLYYAFGERSALRGFSAGAAWYYVGARVAGRSTRIQVANDAYRLMPLPDYSLFDLTAAYAWKGITLRGKLSNVANALSYNVHDDNAVMPIAPRQVSLSLAYRF